jgi:hypothetical protein
MTPEEIAALLQQPNRQQALLDVLRGKQSLGYAGQLTGDKVLAPFGANLQREASIGLEDAQARPNAALGRALEYARLQDQERRTKQPDPEVAGLRVEKMRLTNEVLKKSLAGKPKPVGPTKDEKKQAAADALIAIPGYDHDASIGLKPEVADKLRSAVADTQTLEENVAALAALVRKHGVTGFPGSTKEQMRSLLTDIQLGLKGPAQYELGVLAGPDMALIESVTGDPTKFDALVKGGADTAASKLEGVAQRARQRAENKLALRGYKRAAAKAAASAPLSPKDEQAMKWAEANPDDPRSAAILKKLGVQ